MALKIWENCLSILENEYSSSQLSTWLRPLQVEKKNDSLVLYAPNKFVVDWVTNNDSSYIIFFNYYIDVFYDFISINLI